MRAQLILAACSLPAVFVFAALVAWAVDVFCSALFGRMWDEP